MKTILRAGMILAIILSAALAGTASAAPSSNSGQCPGATSIGNTPTSDGSIVLAAGLTVCIHAGNGNTGIFETDGKTTLADYILASGLVNNGGQVPNVSNYVVYTEGEPSSTPSSDPSPSPSATPVPSESAQPSDAPSDSPSPSVTPSPSSVPSESVTPSLDPSAPTGTVTPCGFVSDNPCHVTLPPTDTTSEAASTSDPLTIPFLFVVMAVVLGSAAYQMHPRRVRRS